MKWRENKMRVINQINKLVEANKNIKTGLKSLEERQKEAELLRTKNSIKQG